MSFIYLASPYSHSDPAMRHQRYEEVCQHTAFMLKGGRLAVYAPIVHNHAIARMFDLPDDAEYWRWYNERMLEAALSLNILQLKGWESSKGLQGEIVMAEERRMPIHYVPPRKVDGTLLYLEIPTSPDTATDASDASDAAVSAFL